MRMMLLNGVYGAPEHFDALRAELAPECETEVFAFRRDGLTDPSPLSGFAPMVDRLDSALGAFAPPANGGRPALLGFSLGGTLALEYVLAHPRRVRALVLVNSFARYEQGVLQAGSLPAIRNWPPAWAYPEVTARIVHQMEWLRRGLFHSGIPIRAIEQGVRAAGGATTHDDLRFQLAHLELGEPPGHAARLATAAETTPIMLLASRDDVVVPPRHTDALALRMPRAHRLPLFEGGHAFFQYDAHALARVVQEFLAAHQ